MITDTAVGLFSWMDLLITAKQTPGGV